MGFFSNLEIGDDYKYRRKLQVFPVLWRLFSTLQTKPTQPLGAFKHPSTEDFTMYFRHLVFLLACSAASVHALPGPVPDDETSACDKENGAQCILEPDCEDLGRFCCTGPLSPNDGNPTECTSCMSPSYYFPYRNQSGYHEPFQNSRALGLLWSRPLKVFLDNSNAFKCTEDGFENVYCCSFALVCLSFLCIQRPLIFILMLTWDCQQSEGGMGVGCVKWKL